MKIKNNLAKLLLPISMLIGSNNFSSAQNQIKETSQKKIFETLDSKVFKESRDTIILKDWISIHSDIVPIFLDSTNFEKNKNNIIIENPQKKSEFILYLPIDLQIKDIPNIIKQINNFTFGKNLPNKSSYKELQQNMLEAIKLLENVEEKDETRLFEISKYKELYNRFFGEKLESDKNNPDELFKESIDKIDQDTIQNLEHLFSTSMKSKLYEAILEYGTKSFSNITETRKIVPIQKYKQELKITKKENLAKKQIEIVNDIMYKIHNSSFFKEPGTGFTMTGKEILAQSAPSKIIKTGEVQCIGYSNMLHYILQEIGIKHYVITMPMHSSVLVEIGGIYFLCDLKSYDELIKIKILKKYLDVRDIEWIQDGRKANTLVKVGDPEKEIMGQLIQGMSVLYNEKENKKEMEEIFLKALELSPRNYRMILKILRFYEKTGEEKKAWDMYQDFKKTTNIEIPFLSRPKKPK